MQGLFFVLLLFFVILYISNYEYKYPPAAFAAGGVLIIRQSDPLSLS
jgi:hypothetical protein